MRQPLRAFLMFAVALLSFSACGCTKGYNFEVTGTIRSVVDGNPITGARITVNTRGKKDRADLDGPTTQTDKVGGFTTQRFFVSIKAFDEGQPIWYLKIEKEGYLPDFVEIKPRSAPELNGNTSTIVAIIYLRPVK